MPARGAAVERRYTGHARRRGEQVQWKAGQGAGPALSAHMTHLMRFTLLAPDIVEAILDGSYWQKVTLARVLNPDRVGRKVTLTGLRVLNQTRGGRPLCALISDVRELDQTPR